MCYNKLNLVKEIMLAIMMLLLLLLMMMKILDCFGRKEELTLPRRAFIQRGTFSERIERRKEEV